MLIGFFSTRLEANKAAVKAVLMNKIGDVGLMIATATVASQLGTEISGIGNTPNVWLFLTIALAAKSAQFGLHGW